MKRGYYLFPLLAASLAACGASSSGGGGDGGAQPADNPRSGWTTVGGDDYTQKICDGTRLIYEYGDNGITTVENAPECGGTGSQTPNPFGTP